RSSRDLELYRWMVREEDALSAPPPVGPHVQTGRLRAPHEDVVDAGTGGRPPVERCGRALEVEVATERDRLARPRELEGREGGTCNLRGRKSGRIRRMQIAD